MEHLKKYYKKYPAARWWRFQVLSKFFRVFPHHGVCITLYFYDDNDDNGVGGGSGSGGVAGNDDDDDGDNDRALSFDTFANEQARNPHQQSQTKNHLPYT